MKSRNINIAWTLSCIALLTVAVESLEDRWNDAMLFNKKGEELANWLVETETIQEYTGLKGEHVVMNVRNLYTQAVSGVNYKFTMEMLVGGNEVCTQLI
jgi:hypothetical protein